MNRIYLTFLISLFLNQCSLNDKIGFLNKDTNAIEPQDNVKKIFEKEKILITELNPNLKLDLSNLNYNEKSNKNLNNFGINNYLGNFTKKINYKYSKFNSKKIANFKPIILDNSLIFFDKKGTIIKYDKSKKIIWKNNFYKKFEKKLNPKLFLAYKDEILLVADNIANIYAVNIMTGDLLWKSNGNYPYNSEIKIYDNQFYVIDYQNSLNCYNIINGKKCWKFLTQETFTLSDQKNSLIITNEGTIIFNNSIGDITAVDEKNGIFKWILPTENSEIINQAFDFKISKLTSDGTSIFFSTNKNKLYSIDIKTGTINWISKVSSYFKPIIFKDLIISVSEKGYLYTIQKDKGNIIRINDILKDYSKKKKNKIILTGSVIGQDKLYLSLNNDKVILVDLVSGKFLRTINISTESTSSPIIHNQHMYIIGNNKITQYD